MSVGKQITDIYVKTQRMFLTEEYRKSLADGLIAVGQAYKEDLPDVAKKKVMQLIQACRDESVEAIATELEYSGRLRNHEKQRDELDANLASLYENECSHEEVLDTLEFESALLGHEVEMYTAKLHTQKLMQANLKKIYEGLTSLKQLLVKETKQISNGPNVEPNQSASERVRRRSQEGSPSAKDRTH